MHEWALASSIIEALRSLLKEHRREILSARIVLGELQSIDEEILKYALENLKRGTEVENVEFELVKEEVEFKCRRCSNTWKLSDLREELSDDIRESIHFIPEVVHSFIRCPRCGSRDFEVVRGRGLYIESIVVREK